MHRRRNAVHRAAADRTQEVGVVVDADDAAATTVGVDPAPRCEASHALDHRAIDTAVHDAHRLQQLGLHLEACPCALRGEFGEHQPKLVVERRLETRRDGRVWRWLHDLVSTRPGETRVFAGWNYSARHLLETDTVSQSQHGDQGNTGEGAKW